ncbi:hypothetical protein [Methylobacterium sp. JK268]
MSTRVDCPSAQPSGRSSRIYGVMTGPSEERRVGYLTETLAPTQDLLALAGEAKPTQLFRIAAPCAKSACQHFNGTCTLATRIVASLAPVVDDLPLCQIRATCRWFLQEGREACLRCPQIATDKPDATEEEKRIAAPR